MNVRKRMAVGMLWIVVPIVVAIATLRASYLEWEEDRYRQKIPVEVDVGNVVAIDGESAFREGCGFAVFELSSKMKERIRNFGIKALNGPGPQTVPVNEYEFWGETPYIETGDGLSSKDSWIVGLGCGNMDPILGATINTALRQPGSFFTRLTESVVIVIPSAGIVAFVYYG